MTDQQMRKSKKAVDHTVNGRVQPGPDLSSMVPVHINPRTVIYIRSGESAAKAKDKYLTKLAKADEPPPKRGRPKK